MFEELEGSFTPRGFEIFLRDFGRWLRRRRKYKCHQTAVKVLRDYMTYRYRPIRTWKRFAEVFLNSTRLSSWLSSLEDSGNLSSSTLYNYVCTICKARTYLAFRYTELPPTRANFDEVVKECKSDYLKDRAERSRVIMDQAASQIDQVRDLEAWLNSSDVRRDYRETFDKAEACLDDVELLPCSEFCAATRYMIALLLVRGARPSSVYMMRLREIDEAEGDWENDDATIVYVKSHKTSATLGPYPLVFEGATKTAFLMYHTIRRSFVRRLEITHDTLPPANHTESPVFLNTNGKMLSASQLCSAFRKLQTDSPLDETLNTTQVRKSLHTALCDLEGEKQERQRNFSYIHDGLAHSEMTARRHYELNENRRGKALKKSQAMKFHHSLNLLYSRQ